MNHYPRHVGDFAAATLGLSLAERGAYSALLDQYYAHERPLPKDRREVYRIAACASAAERKAVDYVLARYFSEEPDGWHQKRCDEELGRYRERSAQATRNVSSRWNKRNTTVSESYYETDTKKIQTQCDCMDSVILASSHKPVANGVKLFALPIESESEERAQARDAPSLNGKKKRRAALDPDWKLPDDWAEYAMSIRGWDRPKTVLVSRSFRDYWVGKGEPMADWRAVWQNWVRREGTL